MGDFGLILIIALFWYVFYGPHNKAGKKKDDKKDTKGGDKGGKH